MGFFLLGGNSKCGVKVLPIYMVCIIYMRIKDCKVNWFQGIKTNKIPDLNNSALALFSFVAISWI